MDNLLTRVARLPAARERNFEQRAKDAAATFQRSARVRLSSLEREFESAKTEAAEIREQVQQIGNDSAEQSSVRLDELRQAITDADMQFKERLQTYETNLETERQESLKLRAEQAEVFEQAQKDRAVRADESTAEVEKEMRERADQVVLSLESSAQRAAGLVDLVATSSTAGAFSKEANVVRSVYGGIERRAEGTGCTRQTLDRIFVGNPGPGSDSTDGAPALTSGQITLVGQLFDQAKKLLK
jgi:hypothetical protein